MSEANSDTPRFAVVGRQNKGKSSVLATLVEESDNDKIRVGPTPGETTRCYSVPLVLNGETLIEFIDTPGFSRARQALAWLKQHHPDTEGVARIDTVRAFVEAHRDGDEFPDECELLRPILDGAGIVYIVDGSKPFRADFVAEFEILRWTGRPRMAVLNNQSDDSDHSEAWRKHLGEAFNLTREFDAHQAQFDERIRLLRHLLEIEDRRPGAIEKTIDLVEAEWQQRRSEAADTILKLLEKALTTTVSHNVADDNVDRDFKRERVEADLKERYREKIRQLEGDYHQRLVELYHHSDVEFGDGDKNHAVDGMQDLFAEETWQVLGLNRAQLAIAGAIAGLTAGGSIDLATGGATHGVPTVLGAAGGYFAALWKGRALADIKVRNPLSVAGESSVGGVQLSAGPPRDPNFSWVLLDRILFHYHHLVTRSHGRRDAFVIDFSELAKGAEGARAGYTTRFSGERRRTLQKWFTKVTKGDQVDDGEVYELMREVLKEVESDAGVE